MVTTSLPAPALTCVTSTTAGSARALTMVMWSAPMPAEIASHRSGNEFSAGVAISAGMGAELVPAAVAGVGAAVGEIVDRSRREPGDRRGGDAHGGVRGRGGGAIDRQDV